MGESRHGWGWCELLFLALSALTLLIILGIRTWSKPALHSIGFHKSLPAGPEKLIEGFGKVRLNFEPNRGQTDPSVKFLARGPGYTLFLTGQEAMLALRSQESEGRRTSFVLGRWPFARRNAVRIRNQGQRTRDR